MFDFGTVCTGIGAPEVAWAPLGAEPVWMSEIDKAASYVLDYRFPSTPNLGDMTTIAARIRSGEVPAPSVLAGGTPCQSFSLAGLRAGMADPRGQLTLSYVDIINAIDDARQQSGLAPAVAVWENVPGVLTHKDNPFGCFLAGLAGEDQPLQPPGGKWTHAGCVFGPQRAVAWRLLDAQYFGLAQRRKRVLVVASARKGFDPARVLLEWEGVRRDSPPGREEGAVAAAPTANGVGTCGADDNQAQAGHLIPCRLAEDHCAVSPLPSPMWWDGRDVSQTLDAVLHKGRTMPEKNRFPAVLQPIDLKMPPPCMAFALRGRDDGAVPEVHGDGSTIGALRSASGGSSRDYVATIGFSSKDSGGDAADEIAPTLRAMNHSSSHINGGGQAAVCIVKTSCPSPLIEGRSEPRHFYAVRRLLPVEGERLQGFPDGHTDVPYGNKRAPDTHRYKQIGNSMAVPMMRWIGERLIEELALAGDQFVHRNSRTLLTTPD